MKDQERNKQELGNKRNGCKGTEAATEILFISWTKYSDIKPWKMTSSPLKHTVTYKWDKLLVEIFFCLTKPQEITI